MSERSRIDLAALEIGDHFEREIVAADVGQRARLDQQALVAHLVGEVGGAGRAQHRQRRSGLWFIR